MINYNHQSSDKMISSFRGHFSSSVSPPLRSRPRSVPPLGGRQRRAEEARCRVSHPASHWLGWVILKSWWICHIARWKINEITIWTIGKSTSMWLKPCHKHHKPAKNVYGNLIPPIYANLRDGLSLSQPHYKWSCSKSGTCELWTWKVGLPERNLGKTPFHWWIIMNPMEKTSITWGYIFSDTPR